MEQTITLKITKDCIHVSSYFPWDNYTKLPLLDGIYRYLTDNLFNTEYQPITELDRMTDRLLALKPLVPNIKETLETNPKSLIKIVFSNMPIKTRS